jgi:MHS family shikimate/dehydroshikimate transporter-like MFS transporter
VAFLLTIVLTGIGLYVRLQVMETPAFSRVKQAQEEAKKFPSRNTLSGT